MEEVRNNSQIPSWEATRQKALCIAKQLGFGTEFKASKGWITENFIKRLKKKYGNLSPTSVEAELLEWGMEEVRNNSQIPSWEATRLKALCIAKQLGVDTEFKASKGWIADHFIKRLKEKCCTLPPTLKKKFPELESKLTDGYMEEVKKKGQYNIELLSKWHQILEKNLAWGLNLKPQTLDQKLSEYCFDTCQFKGQLMSPCLFQIFVIRTERIVFDMLYGMSP
jgi:hypothetical protein